MYYFDNKFLAQYIDQQVSLKVYANDDWYIISDLSDLENFRRGVGYDEFGNATEFDYRNITKIKAGGQLLTLDKLNAQMTGKPPEEEEKPEPDAEPEEEPAAEEEPPPEEKPKKEPDLSWYSPAYDVGRQLMKELENHRKRNAKI